MTISLRRRLSFILGLGFTLLPLAGPAIGLIFLLLNRVRPRRSDIVWAIAALFTALSLAATSGIRGATLGFMQIALPWLVFRSFAHIARLRHDTLRSHPLGLGLLAGLALVIALGWLRIEALQFDIAKTISQAIVWGVHPALFGHAVLTLGLLIAIVTPSTSVRLGSLGLAALGILVSGSREAAIAGVVALLLLILVGGYRSLRTRLIEGALMLFLIVIATGLSPLLGWGRVGFLVEASGDTASPNLLLGTEIARGDWWDTSWVEVATDTEIVAGEPLTVYATTKDGAEGWLRLQQLIDLEPGETYTLSAWIERGTAHEPGLQGWGRIGESRTFFVGGTLRDGRWIVELQGEGDLLASGIADSQESWDRVFVTFRYREVDPVVWYVGMAPDVRTIEGSTTRFAGFQLERGPLGTYWPGGASEGLTFGVARLPFWRTALEGIPEAPWFGHGTDSFPSFFTTSRPERNRLHVTPAHPHNLLLEVLFELGIVGSIGLFALVLALIWPAIRLRDTAMLTVAGAVAIANLFDSSLFTAGVLYPFAAVAGWRSVTERARTAEVNRHAHQAAVRATLAATDLLAALAALGAAKLLQRLLIPGSEAGALGSPSLLLHYGMLLWPLLAWREGLYPGYGLTPPQELRKQVIVSSTAGLLLGAISLLTGGQLSLSGTMLVLITGLATILLPIGRGLTKRLLHTVGAWGRPVVVLGAGETGQRVIEGLLRTPLGGLTPIALFDDDPDLHRQRISGLRVIGSLADADAFAERHSVTHAIVAIPSLNDEALAQLLDVRGRRFRVMQFVPKLAGIPTEDVVASDLDGMLALEVRKGLYLRYNRILKRALDLVGGLVGTLLISPLLLAIYLWIRLDSRGPGFYWSERIGENGDPFLCLKFRTMYVDADERLGEMMAKSTGIREEYRRFHKLVDDPRITRAGKLLRKVSLDELAQLYNVIRGDMSLVGPRPYLVRERSDMDGRGEVIFQAKPGMTGYWQTAGRNERTFEERLDMETHYVRNWSLWWDLIILIETVPAVLRRRGAL